MNNKVNSYKLGAIEIHAPTASEKRCSIFEDLAELLNIEYNSDAVSKIKSEWKSLGYKGKLDIDAESDFVSIVTSKSSIVDLVVLINNLSSKKHQLNDKSIQKAKKEIKKWKQPEPFPWSIGDIFFVQLSKNIIVYGQVLDKTVDDSPTCLLFSLKSEEIIKDINLIVKTTPISILHVNNDHLNDGSWKVIGNTKPILNPNSGPCGTQGAIGCRYWDGFETLAKAWHCLTPWNKYYKETLLDESLLDGVTKPRNVILLERKELEKIGVKREEWN